MMKDEEGVVWCSHLRAGFEGPESPRFEDDPVPLAEDEGHHADHHHQQDERRQDGHDPQVAGRRLHHSCTDMRTYKHPSLA